MKDVEQLDGFELAEMRFRGDPIDYIMFPGLNDGGVTEIVWWKRERAAVVSHPLSTRSGAAEDKKIRFEMITIPEPLPTPTD